MEAQEPNPIITETSTFYSPRMSLSVSPKRGRGRPKKADPIPVERQIDRTREKIITITFTDGSVYIAKNVTSFGTTDTILYFSEAKNTNKVTYVFARSIKTYEVEPEINPT